MSKIALSTLVMILVGCASASGWRDLRIDARDQASFVESVSLIQQELPHTRGQLFALALQDIWTTGTSAAGAANSDGYTEEDYFGQLDGLSYHEVMALADSTGPATIWRYTSARWSGRQADPSAGFASPTPQPYIAPGRAPAWASNPWAGVSPYPLNHP